MCDLQCHFFRSLACRPFSSANSYRTGCALSTYLTCIDSDIACFARKFHLIFIDRWLIICAIILILLCAHPNHSPIERSKCQSLLRRFLLFEPHFLTTDKCYFSLYRWGVLAIRKCLNFLIAIECDCESRFFIIIEPLILNFVADLWFYSEIKLCAFDRVILIEATKWIATVKILENRKRLVFRKVSI